MTLMTPLNSNRLQRGPRLPRLYVFPVLLHKGDVPGTRPDAADSTLTAAGGLGTVAHSGPQPEGPHLNCPPA